MTQTAQQPETAVNVNEAQIISTFKAMRAESNRIAMKIGELEGEKEEHRLVIETLEPLDLNRKCFRLMNGVLVERTVGEFLPVLKLNHENISQIIERLVKTFQEKLKELNEFQAKHKIRIDTTAQLNDSN